MRRCRRSHLHRAGAWIPAVVLGLLLAVVTARPGAAQEKPRVAILSFENRTQMWGADLGNAAADQLTTELVALGSFSVIERQQLEAILQEQGFQLSGQVNPNQVVEIGRIAGVDYLVTGAVSRFSIDRIGGSLLGRNVGYTEAESEVNVRAFSTTTAEMALATEGSGKKRLVSVSGVIDMSSPYDAGVAAEALGPAMENVAEAFQDAAGDFEVTDRGLNDPTPPEIVGTSAAGEFYINQGQEQGIEVGQRFEVWRVMDEIVDSNGEVLDQITDRVGVLEVTRVLSRSAISTVVEGDAQEGDTLRPAG